MASDVARVSACPVCGVGTRLLRCQGCKLLFYCGLDHQVADRDHHKQTCDDIQKAQQKVDEKEQKLSSDPDDIASYLSCRYNLVERILQIKTLDAVESASNHIMDMHRPCRGYGLLKLREITPCLLLRVRKEQQCYDFLKWWAVVLENPHFNWGDVGHSALDLENENAFEPVDLFTRGFIKTAGHLAAVTLIKYRILVDVRALQDYSDAVCDNPLPQEIHDNVRRYLVCDAVRNNRAVMNSPDQALVIEQLETQLRQLYRAVKRHAPCIWPILLVCQGHPEMRGVFRDSRTATGMLEIDTFLDSYYDLWAQTPGAIDFIRALSSE